MARPMGDQRMTPDNDRVMPIPECGCWIWLGKLDRKGYGRVWGATGETFAHRQSWIQRNGHDPGNLCVLHKCDVPSCVNPDHLFLGDRADNMADMYAKGRGGQARGGATRIRNGSVRGANNQRAKLTEAEAREIIAADGPHKAIAGLYGITKETVRRIKKGDRWPHLQEECA